MITPRPRLFQWPWSMGHIWHQTSKSYCFYKCSKTSFQRHWPSTWANQFWNLQTLFCFGSALYSILQMICVCMNGWQSTFDWTGSDHDQNKSNPVPMSLLYGMHLAPDLKTMLCFESLCFCMNCQNGSGNDSPGLSPIFLRCACKAQQAVWQGWNFQGGSWHILPPWCPSCWRPSFWRCRKHSECTQPFSGTQSVWCQIGSRQMLCLWLARLQVHCLWASVHKNFKGQAGPQLLFEACCSRQA